jgi:hypothetical protein
MNIQLPTSNFQHSMARVWRGEPPMWNAWFYSLLLPLPAVLFWHSHDGRFIALCLFFAGCTGFIAWAFCAVSSVAAESRPPEIWGRRLLFLGVALLPQWIIFSALCLAFNDAHDVMAPVLALGSLIPALTVTPYLALATRKPFATVVLTAFLLGCMKILGCVAVVLVYGWDADARGYTTLTWTHPNLLVCLLLLNTALLSTSFYFLGRKKFTRDLTVQPVFGLEVHRRKVSTSLSHET